MRPLRAFLVSVLLLGASPALAGDGVVEINQACATSKVAGCFSGDAKGLPVTIDGSAGRSYRLTSDLTVGHQDNSGIVVSAPDVSIDLGGFAIRGPNVCNGAPGGCAYAGTGVGIEATSGSAGDPDRLRVANGSIVGMGSIGIFAGLGNGIVVRDVRIAHNGGFGILFHGDSATIDHVTATRNGNTGVIVSSSGSVQSSHLDGNASGGAQVGNGSRVESSTFRSNAGGGLWAGYGTAVDGCEIVQNGNHGVYFHAGILPGGQTLGGAVRGSVVSRNQGEGIVATTGVLISQNSVVQNTGAGLSLFESAYGDNLIVGNPGGAVIGSNYVNLGGNACLNQGATPVTCP